MKRLIFYYVFLFSVLKVDFIILLLINYMNDIEKFCNVFLEMVGLVSLMFVYIW